MVANAQDIARFRLRNQRLSGAPFARPEQVVGFIGAVQSQDYAGAKWAVAQRTRRCSEAEVEAAYTRGAILRTHVLRPTWHFVTATDIRWLLALTAPRVRKLLAYYDRKLEIDAALLRRCRDVLARALRDGALLTRDELGKKLDAARISLAGQRLGHVLMHVELDALICSGPRRGKQFTYALVDERVPVTAARSREESLAELTRRYFASHGPALAQDFAWWSGLTLADTKLGLELNREHLEQLRVDAKSYWFVPPLRAARSSEPLVHLLPNYDEHVASYKDYAPSFNRERVPLPNPGDDLLFHHVATLDGQIIAGWQRTLAKDHAAIHVQLLARLDRREKTALQRAVERYAAYLKLPARLTQSGSMRSGSHNARGKLSISRLR